MKTLWLIYDIITGNPASVQFIRTFAIITLYSNANESRMSHFSPAR